MPPRMRSNASCVLQPSERGLHHIAESGHLFEEMGAAGWRDAIGPAAIIRFEWTDPARLHKAGDSAVQGARAEFDAGELLDVEHHAVTVFIAVGQAGEDQKSGVGHE